MLFICFPVQVCNEGYLFFMYLFFCAFFQLYRNARATNLIKFCSASKTQPLMNFVVYALFFLDK